MLFAKSKKCSVFFTRIFIDKLPENKTNRNLKSKVLYSACVSLKKIRSEPSYTIT